MIPFFKNKISDVTSVPAFDLKALFGSLTAPSNSAVVPGISALPDWTVQCSFACDKGNNTTGTYFIQCFCKEVIMDQEFVPIVFLIYHLVLSKRNISNGKIKKVIWICSFSKPHICMLACGYSCLAIRPEILSSSTPYKLLFFHGVRHHAQKKFPTPHCRFQTFSFGKTHSFQSTVKFAG